MGSRTSRAVTGGAGGESTPPPKHSPGIRARARLGWVNRFHGFGFLSLLGLALLLQATPASAAGACSNEELRQQQGATHLAGCRAYEMVSPVDKNFGDVDAGEFPKATAARDGEAAGWCTGSPMVGEPYSGVCSDLVSHRGSDGWQTAAVHPPYCSADYSTRSAGAVGFANLSPDLAFAAIVQPEASTCAIDPIDPAAPDPQSNLYREHLGIDTPPDFQLLAPEASFTPGFRQLSGTYQSASPDFSHIVYTSTGQQTGDAPAGNFNKIFEWVNGSVRLVSVKPEPDGTPFTEATDIPGRFGGSSNGDATNTVSVDGRRIFFHAPTISFISLPATANVYMREDGQTTYQVTESECSSDCGAAAGKVFQFASEDGSRVLFRTNERLTDEQTPSGRKLYMYTHSADPAGDPGNLQLLTKDDEPADGTDAQYNGILGIDETAETVFFVASGQLVAGEPTAAGPKVYRWSFNDGSPTLDYLATLSTTGGFGGPVDSVNWSALSLYTLFGLGKPQNRLVTPDGEYLVVETLAALDPAADTDTTADIYRWSEAEGWRCLSCQDPGLPSAGGASIAGTLKASNIGMQNERLRIVMSDDGSHVFFTTPDALKPGDVNGTVKDLYEWSDGEVSLVSGGSSDQETVLIGASTSGRDVFFITRQQLVGWDGDYQTDVYDARIGGGFPEPPADPARCVGAGCRGPASQAEAVGPPTSANFRGPGNRVERARRHCGRHGRKAARFGRGAKRLRARARRAAGGKRAKRLHRRAHRLSGKAKRQARKAKRCRNAKRRAGK